MIPSVDPAGSVAIRRLIGIYNADGSLRGELTYLLAKLSGRAPCALCDITHNWVRPSRDFQQAVRELPVPFDFVHSDTRSRPLRNASREGTPCVVAETDAGLRVLLGPEEIERCAGDPSALLDAILRAAGDRALGWRRGPVT